MKFNAIYAVLLIPAILSTANAGPPAAKAPPAKAPATIQAVASPIKAAVTPTNNTNGEGLPNGSPTDTGCVDACNVYPPPATDGNTANSLEVYHLAWFPSYKAGDMLNMSFWTAYNPSVTGAPPTTVNIDLFDQYGKVNLGSIAQNVAIKAGAANTPFVVEAWKIPATVTANFNVSNQFMIVFSGANNWRRDRLLQIQGITANPGGGPNPALANAVSGQTPVGSGMPNGTATATGSTSTSTSTAAIVKSDRWIVVCMWTFLIAQVVGFVLV